MLYFSRRFKWSLYALLGSLAVCGVVRAEESPTISTSAALGSLPVPASVTPSTPTYAIEESNPTPAEEEQEYKRH